MVTLCNGLFTIQEDHLGTSSLTWSFNGNFQGKGTS
jgi:hypothetical protein